MDLDAAFFRAQTLKKIRLFFEEGGVLEVQTACFRSEAVIDAHIDLFSFFEYSATELGLLSSHQNCSDVTQSSAHPPSYFLQSSPELAMKSLLCKGFPSIYQIAPAFRKGEIGTWHATQFTLCEWYQLGWGVDQMMDEVAAVASLVLGKKEMIKYVYGDLFLEYCDINPYTSSEIEILAKIKSFNLPDPISNEKDDLLDYLLSLVITPKLPRETLVFVTHYPASQAVFAELDPTDLCKSLRFELVYSGVELANGWQECTSATEIKRRLCIEQEKQKRLGKKPQPLPTQWITQLDRLPKCSGVALGLDRLLGLARGVGAIAGVE